jgi:lysophospholipase L1-like esterase
MNHIRRTFALTFAMLMIAVTQATVTQASAAEMPTTLISHMPGVHAFASSDLAGKQASSGANNGIDDVYGGWGHYWRTFTAYPAWLAVDLSAVPGVQRGKVLVAWYNLSYGYDNGTGSPTAAGYSEPGDYVLEGNAAPGSMTAAPTSGWVNLGVSVTGNALHSRTHAVDLTGYNWIRFHATAGAINNLPGAADCSIKLEIFDLSHGNTDSWAFLGDSIVAGGMGHDDSGGVNIQPGGSRNFGQAVAAAIPGAHPANENAGIPFDTAQNAGARRLAVLLANSQARYIAIAYGLNDAAGGTPADDRFYKAYAQMVDMVLAAGRIPVIPTISWPQVPALAAAVGDPVTGGTYTLNRQLAKLKADYRAMNKTIIDGPDLWSYFKAHPNLIEPGGPHPTIPDGYIAYRDLWSDAMIANVYGGAPTVPKSGNRK